MTEANSWLLLLSVKQGGRYRCLPIAHGPIVGAELLGYENAQTASLETGAE
jgi:hypothetical protein